jgi:hypothetical protein
MAQLAAFGAAISDAQWYDQQRANCATLVRLLEECQS